jgi:hypothetical protein
VDDGPPRVAPTRQEILMTGHSGRSHWHSQRSEALIAGCLF